MYETFGFETLTAPQAAVGFALILGALFGVLAERLQFCFRRGLVGADSRAAMGVWLTAVATALVGTQAAVALELITFEDHRFFSADLPWAAILVGGLLFGGGMVLTRGCVSRLTVLTATGNLRALLVLAVLAVTAHAALKGVLSPIVTTLADATVEVGDFASLAALPGGALVWTLVLTLGAAIFAVRSGNRVPTLIGAMALGALVPLGWVGTGFVLYDDFDPITMESLSFISPWTETLFWTVASTAVPAGFGVGLVGGVLLGSFVSAAVGRRLAWQSFSSPSETGRYLAGAGMMGLGGVLAGGCTVGAGLSGVPTLSVAALLALGSIALGARVMHSALDGARTGGGVLTPAE